MSHRITRISSSGAISQPTDEGQEPIDQVLYLFTSNIEGMTVRHHRIGRTYAIYGIIQCYLLLGSNDFPAFTPAKTGTQFSNPGGMQSWPGWWLHPKIVCLPKMVIYLRNNQAVSWLGLGPATQKPQIWCPKHYTTEPQLCTITDSLLFAQL